jgi:hypothetical protein
MVDELDKSGGVSGAANSLRKEFIRQAGDNTLDNVKEGRTREKERVQREVEREGRHIRGGGPRDPS